MIRHLKIWHKLAFSYFMIGSVTVIVISLIFYFAFKNALIERASAQLTSVNILKKTQLEQYFEFRKTNLQLIAKDEVIQNILKHPDHSIDGQQQDYLLQLQKGHSYADLILLDSNNNIAYPMIGTSPVFHLLEAATSRSIESEGRDKAINAFVKNGAKRFTLLDATQYLPSHQSTLLISHPVIANSRYIGSMVLQRPFAEMERILFERTGMGQTGESYIVSDDYKLRSASRFFPDKIPYKLIAQSGSVDRGLQRHEEVELLDDYRGVTVLSAHRKLLLPDLNWVILSEIDYTEALTPVLRIKNYIIGVGAFLMVIIIIITLALAQKISRPIVELNQMILQLSHGILPGKISPAANDEIGEMTLAMNNLIDGIRRTSVFAKDIGNGNFNIHFSPLSDKDILGLSLIQMRDKLAALQKKEAAMMRERSSALLEGQEKERRRISRELHDGIGQMLTVIRFRLATIEGYDVLQKELKNLIDDTIAEVRRISNNVMPSVLLDFGLESALRTLCSNTNKYTNVNVEFIYKKEEETVINFETSVSLYRIGQEALNNIVKYADATHASLEVHWENNNIYMQIKDDGSGFDMDEYSLQEKRSNGIKNMKERVHLLQGQFTITSTISQGTRILVKIPLFESVV